MSSIENRVVKMTFDNQAFSRNASETLSMLDKLKQAMSFSGSKDGIKDLSQAMGEFDGSRMADAVENISSKFSALGAIGFTVIQRLTNSAMSFVRNLAGNIMEPLLGGGKRRGMNLEQAEFMLAGAGLDVEATMDSALKAVEGTSYGLDSAAKAAGQFGASGVKAGDEMTRALRGIAGTAAMTNTAYDEMADIFTTAAGKGVVGNMELMRIQQRGLNVTAKLGEEWNKTGEEVKEMARNGEISFAMFAEAMDGAFGEHAQKANETYSGSLANLKTAIARIGAMYFVPQMEQQRDLFNSLSGVVKKLAEAFAPLINVFVRLRGFANENLIKWLDGFDSGNLQKAISNLGPALVYFYVSIQRFFGTIRDAFREIFPSSNSSALVKFSELLLKFSEAIYRGGTILGVVKGAFMGFFAIIRIGMEIVKGLFATISIFFKTLTSVLFGVPGAMGSAAGSIGDFVVRLKEMLVEGGAIESFFNKIRNAIMAMGRHLYTARMWISDLFGDGIPGAALFRSIVEGISGAFSGVKGGASKAGSALAPVKKVFGDILSVIGTIIGEIKNFLGLIWGAFASFWSALADGAGNVFTADAFEPAMKALSAGLLGGILLQLRKFFKSGLKLDMGQFNLLESISGTFDELTGTLKAMQANLKAEMLMKIAKALALLTASILVLSFIDPKKIASSLAALATGMGSLVGALALLSKITVNPKSMASLGAGLMFLSVSALFLSFALRSMARMDFGEMMQGLLGLAGLMGVLAIAVNVLSKNTPGMVKAAFSLIVLSAGMWLFSKVVKAWAAIPFGDLVKGLGAIGVALAGFVIAMNVINPAQITKVGLGFVLFAFGLKGLEKAISGFAEMDLGYMIKGFVGLSVALTILITALRTMPGDLTAKAGGLIAMSAALIIMSVAVRMMGSIPFGDLLKGLIGLGLALGMLVIAANAMTTAAPGAAAMIAMSAALVIMSAAMKMMAQLSIGQIVASLLAFAGMLLILGLGAALMAPVVPVLFLLSGALLLLGAGFALFGAGAFLAVSAFVALAAAGVAGTGALITSLFMLAKAMPGIIATFVRGLGQVVVELINLIPTFVGAIGELLSEILGTVRDLVPEIVETLGTILSGAVQLIRENAPEFISLGFELLLQFMQNIRDNIGEIVSLGADILFGLMEGITEKIPEFVDLAVNMITTFLNSIASRMTDIVNAGVNLLISFILGVASRIGDIVGVVTQLITNFITAVGNSARKIMDAGVGALNNFLEGLAENIGDVADKVGDIIVEFIEAVGRNAEKVARAGTDTAIEFMDGMVDNAVRFADRAGNAILKLLEGLRKAIDKYSDEIRAEGLRLAGALINGMTGGLAEKAGGLLGGIRDLGGRAVSAMAGAIGAQSPARKFIPIGKAIPEGLSVGLDKGGKSFEKATANLGAGAVRAIEDALSGLGTIDEFSPRIRPVLDLDDLKNDAKGISSLFGDTPSIDPTTSYNRARDILRSQSRPVMDEPTRTSETSELTFIQNNYSPEALSTADIYRYTKSQFALAKEELKVP